MAWDFFAESRITTWSCSRTKSRFAKERILVVCVPQCLIQSQRQVIIQQAHYLTLSRAVKQKYALPPPPPVPNQNMTATSSYFDDQHRMQLYCISGKMLLIADSMDANKAREENTSWGAIPRDLSYGKRAIAAVQNRFRGVCWWNPIWVSTRKDKNTLVSS